MICSSINWRRLCVVLFLFFLIASCSAPTALQPASLSTQLTTQNPTLALPATFEPSATSVPTSIPSLVPTPQPSATQIPTPTQAPWILESAISKLPEVYTELVTPEIIDQYVLLLQHLPQVVQEWIVGIGWGLEDLVLDTSEIALIALLVDKNLPTAMSILTHPDIVDGVTSDDVAWAKEVEVLNIAALLKDDIDQLLEQGLLSEGGFAGITDLIGMADTDPAVAKGLYMVHNYGHPAPNIFSYPLPDYNTQLFILGQLAELGIPQGYELAALAAALDYGSLWTFSDAELRTSIVQYAYSMVFFQAETDPVIREKGAYWQAKDLPLEAQISLVWGAPGNYYPLTEGEAERIGMRIEPFKSWVGYREAFSDRPMSKADWEFVSIELATLQDMRSYFSKGDILTSSPDALASLFFSKYIQNIDYQQNPIIREIDGWQIYNAYICNPDWEWVQIKGIGNYQGRAVGSSGDAYLHTFLLKSLNFPGITPTFVVHQSGYYDILDGTWKASTAELKFEDGREIDTRLGWNKVPYDNFWLPTIEGNWTGRQRILIPTNPRVTWRNGLPGSYIFRADLSSEPAPEMPPKVP